MISRVVGRFSCLRPIRIEVLPRPIIHFDKRPSAWQKMVDLVDIDKNQPCTHLPHHLTGADKTWPPELRSFPYFVFDKKETADLLRKIYPREPRLIEFAKWLDSVAESHPEHSIIATELVITPALLLSCSAVLLVLRQWVIT